MTLEDFFTLTEMKDGLMALTRVEELVSVMRAEKDSVVTNVGEAARQWCTVASTLAATETKDSLSHFIQLDGLDFLDRWLQEAKRCRNDTSDSSLEESIVALLGALEKLPIDKEKSVSSGISITVKDLFDDKSSIVQEKARALFNSWNQRTDKDVDHQEVEKNGGCHDNGVAPVDATAAVESASLKQSVLDSSPVEGSTDLVNHVVQPVDGELSRRGPSSDSSQLEGVKEVNVSSPNDQDMCQTKLNCVGKEDGGKAQDTSVTSPCQGSLAIMEDQKASMEICSSSNPTGSNIEGRSLDVIASKSLDVLAPKSLDVLAPKSLDVLAPKSLDVLASKASSNDGRETDVIKGTQERFGRIEACSLSVSSEHVSSSVDPANVQHSASQSTIRSTSDAKECEFSLKKTLSADLDSIGTLASKPKVGTIGGGGPKHSRGSVLEITVPTGGSHSDVLQETPNTASSLRKPEDLNTSFSRKEDTGAINNLKELGGESISKIRAGKKSATVSAVSKSMMGTKILDKIDTRRSDMELDYGVEDALEVARQVAKEVEREVVDYREEFCSSSSEKDSGGFVQPGSPNSINREQEQPATGLENEVRIRQNLTSGAISPKGKDHLKSTENMDKDKDCMQDPDSSQVTEAAQEPVVNTDKSMCDFDLNKEVSSEEMDHPTTPTSAPITVVSASRAAAPGFPLAPLHFEGKLGWKGSAATSAFRPASLCRTSDGEKTVSIDGNVQSSKQRQDFHDIDLNVAGGDHDGAIDLVVLKPVPASSDLHSGESSVEVSSRIAERLKLDLNRLGDNEETPSDWRMEGGFHQYHRNGHYSPSPASSSSSRAPSMRNIDLNDNPSLFDHSNDHRPDHGKASSLDMNTCGGIKLDDPVISIMGTRVEVNKKESILQTRSFLPNGQVSEPLIGANFARSSGGGVGMRHAMTYSASPPMFGYNGIQAGPSMSLSPAMYGPGSVPYMVDSRGSPVLPQIMGSPVGVPPSYSRPQFLMSMTSPLSGMNGVGAVRPNLDLNSGMAFVEAENREPGGLRQLFIPGQGMIMEEQMRSASQPMSSGVGVKRKEPDGSGWDLFPVGYKQKSPWH